MLFILKEVLLATGGIFQLICNNGAQDRYLMGNPNIINHNVHHRTPKTLADFALKSLSEKEKSWISANKEAFPKLFDKILKLDGYNYKMKSVIKNIKSFSNFMDENNGSIEIAWWKFVNTKKYYLIHKFDQLIPRLKRFRIDRYKQRRNDRIQYQKDRQRNVQLKRIQNFKKLDSEGSIDDFFELFV